MARTKEDLRVALMNKTISDIQHWVEFVKTHNKLANFHYETKDHRLFFDFDLMSCEINIHRPMPYIDLWVVGIRQDGRKGFSFKITPDNIISCKSEFVQSQGDPSSMYSWVEVVLKGKDKALCEQTIKLFSVDR